MINWFLSKESLLGAQHHGVEAMKAMKAMKVSKIAKGKGWLSMVSTREPDGEGSQCPETKVIPPIGFEGKHGNEYCSSN